jgi:DNA-binding LytR/AlgR family response regulator
MILKRINTNLNFDLNNEPLFNLTNAEDERHEKSFIFIKANQSLIKVNYSEINYIEGLKDYVKIYTGNKNLITKCTIKSLEKKLPKDSFIRIHKSYIVSVDKINKIELNQVFLQHKQIPIGQLYREPFLNLINYYSL